MRLRNAVQGLQASSIDHSKRDPVGKDGSDEECIDVVTTCHQTSDEKQHEDEEVKVPCAWCFPMEPFYEVNPGMFGSRSGNSWHILALNSAYEQLIALNSWHILALNSAYEQLIALDCSESRRIAIPRGTNSDQ